MTISYYYDLLTYPEADQASCSEFASTFYHLLDFDEYYSFV